MIYIGHNNGIPFFLEIEEELNTEDNVIVYTWEDFIKNEVAWLKLSADQESFYNDHPDATPEEVYNMLLTPEPIDPEPEPEPTPEELLQTAQNIKQIEVYNQDIRHYYLDGNDIHVADRLGMKDKCSKKESITINAVAYPSNIIVEAINEMADYNEKCNKVIESLIKAIQNATTVEEVELISVAVFPDVIHRTTEELQSAIDYKKQHDPEVQVLRVNRMTISAMTMDDTTAIKNKYGHAEWIDFIGGKLEIGNRVLYNDWLWKVRQPINPVLEIYPPSIDTAALYERLDENHEGTEFDPKLYASGMALEQDKYYTELDDGVRVKYFCYRGSIDPVYSKLKDLVDLYVRPVD